MEEVPLTTTQYVMISFMVLIGVIGIGILVFSILGLGKKNKKK